MYIGVYTDIFVYITLYYIILQYQYNITLQLHPEGQTFGSIWCSKRLANLKRIFGDVDITRHSKLVKTRKN